MAITHSLFYKEEAFLDVIKIGQYTLAGTIGKGGTATIHKAYDNRVDRYVAIKMLHHHFLGDENFHESFTREAQIIASVEHNAIVPIYDFGEHADQPYIVMRYMRGGTLRDYLKSGDPLTLTKIEQIITRVCAALEKLHNYGVIHRDLKPSNILFDEDGAPYLADFGLARLAELTLTGEGLTGSPHYMSPEQARGSSVDKRTDIYQIGVILYEMLTGQRPFTGESPDAVLYQHIHEPAPLLPHDADHIPPGMDKIIDRALSKNKEDRYESAGELLTEFNQVLKDWRRVHGEESMDVVPYDDERTRKMPEQEQSSTVESQPEQVTETANPADPPQLQKKRRRWLVPVTIIALLAAALLYLQPAFLFGTDDQPEQAEAISTPIPQIETNTPTVETDNIQPAQTTFDAITQSTEPFTFGAAGSELQALGGGTGQIIYTAKRGNNFHLYASDLDGQNELQLTSNTIDDYRPALSPNGQQIVYHAYLSGWQLFVLNLDGSGIAQITDQPSDDSFGRWSPDGSKLIFHSNRNGDFDIFTVNPDGTEITPLTDNNVDDLGPAWSPDGSQIAFHRQTDAGKQVFVMDADGQNATQLTFGRGDSVFPVWSPDGERLVFYSTTNGGNHIFTIKPDGNELRQITVEHNNFYPTWSPNGEWIIYHANVGNENREIWLARADGSEFKQFTTSSDEERMPIWVP